jgi:hypothetical protein
MGPEIIADLAGIYYVSSNTLNCEYAGSFQVQKTEFIDPIVEYGCYGIGDLSIEVINIEPGFTLSYPEIPYEVLVYEYETINDFNYEIHSPYPSCTKIFTYELPFFEGLTISSISEPSCDTCADGQIILDIDESNCIDCTFEDYYIYKLGNLEEDLKNDNMEGILSSGKYYIVAKSEEGCVINSKQIIME